MKLIEKGYFTFDDRVGVHLVAIPIVSIGAFTLPFINWIGVVTALSFGYWIKSREVNS